MQQFVPNDDHRRSQDRLSVLVEVVIELVRSRRLVPIKSYDHRSHFSQAHRLKEALIMYRQLRVAGIVTNSSNAWRISDGEVVL